MRITKKTVILAVALMALITGSVFGTIAYLTDTAEVTNVFSIGNVGIEVTETKVDKNGVVDPVNPGRTTEGNKYPMIPGALYVKDPVMTVDKGSQPAFYRMKVTLNCMETLEKLFPDAATILSKFAVDLNTTAWKLHDFRIENGVEKTITYEYRYIGAEVDTSSGDVDLPALFTQIKIPESFDNEEVKALQNLSMKIVGNAIQKTGFVDDTVNHKTAEDVAWEAFDKQMAEKVATGVQLTEDEQLPEADEQPADENLQTEQVEQQPIAEQQPAAEQAE